MAGIKTSQRNMAATVEYCSIFVGRQLSEALMAVFRDLLLYCEELWLKDSKQVDNCKLFSAILAAQSFNLQYEVVVTAAGLITDGGFFILIIFF
ncbi:hypothetical protein RchiOBHm_Chr6g0280531 [Rosa chinensis]|uniref:Uncharacterized protein n=1 Tax=Rosa chinensis TaxID=74649 RepID=A0A2P6PT94_ROSCH|nr:hypothetical protein RchiOBHm_Chr6g0280531 [Rosa chinensis]